MRADRTVCTKTRATFLPQGVPSHGERLYWGQHEGISAVSDTPTHSWTGLVVTDSRDITDTETVVSCAEFFFGAQPYVHREERFCLRRHCFVRLPVNVALLHLPDPLWRTASATLSERCVALYQPFGSGLSPHKNRRGEKMLLTNRDAPRSITKCENTKRIKKKGRGTDPRQPQKRKKRGKKNEERTKTVRGGRRSPCDPVMAAPPGSSPRACAPGPPTAQAPPPRS